MKNIRDFLRNFIPIIEPDVQKSLEKSKRLQHVLNKRWNGKNTFLDAREYQFLLDYGLISKGKSTIVSPPLHLVLKASSLNKSQLSKVLDELTKLGVVISYDMQILSKPRTSLAEKLEIEISMKALGDLCESLFAKKQVKKRPSEWMLSKKNHTAELKGPSNLVISFPNIDSERFLIFEQLWNNFDHVIEYKDVYEIAKQHSYKLATKSGKTKVNELLRAQVRSLRKELSSTPFIIVTEKGFRLTLS